MSSLKLYKNDWAPPSRAVMMLAEELGLSVTLIDVDMVNGAHLAPEYLKKNPVHAVPVLEDGDWNLSDSHAISAYLVSAYGEDDSLYPKELKARAAVDQMLFFDNGILYQRLRDISSRVWKGMKESEITQWQRDNVEQAYGYLEVYLAASEWLAGDRMTIADLCAVATLSCADMVHPFERAKYPKTTAWWDKLAARSSYQNWCAPGQRGYAEFYKSMLIRNERSE